jgi:protein disulfide-isomerase A6
MHVVDPKVPEIKSKTDFETACVEEAKGYLSSLCLVSFLPILEPEFEESVKLRESLINVLTGLKKTLHEARTKDPSSVPMLHIMWADGSTSTAKKIINKFGVSSDLPSALFLSPKKKAYRPYVGVFEEADLKRFADETRHGKGRVFTYDWDIEFPATEKSQCSKADNGKCTKAPEVKKEKEEKKEEEEKKTETGDKIHDEL